MLPADRISTHPGEVLLEEFLRPLGTSQLDFARQLGIPLQRVNEIVRGKRSVTAETALLFSSRLGTSPEFWLNLQAAYDLGRVRLGKKGRGARHRARVPAGKLAEPKEPYGKPRRGGSAKVISVSVEKDLLSRSDKLAKNLGVSRAGLIERGLRAVLAVEGEL